jgi:predicted nucleotidyltransferase
MINVEQYYNEIKQICDSLPVKRLGLFGSVLNKKFASKSDIDVLVLFDEKQEMDLFDNYFELKEKLEEVFHRQVDLVIDKDFENPFFKKSIEQSREIIYEQ